MIRHLDLFSGIGGFALATEMVWENVAHTFCEIDPYCQSVLRRHWPDATIHDDIRTYRGGSDAVDLITGGFPCQPFSNAGKRKGTADDRHLWPEMLRVIREVRPRWILGENVDGLLTWNDGMVLEMVLSDLESAGYSTQALVIPAAAVEAPHRRDRVWIMAHADGGGHVHREAEKLAAEAGEYALRELVASGEDVADTDRVRFVRRKGSETARDAAHIEGGRTTRGAALRSLRQWGTEPVVGRVAHGVPRRVDRIKALGNAIVPQVAAEIMRAMAATDQYGTAR